MAAATTTAATSTSTMIADSAATISAVPDASDLDTRTGTRRVLMADNSVQDTTPSGLSHMYVHGNDVLNGINITVPTAVLRGLKSRILSLPHVVYELGDELIVSPEYRGPVVQKP